VPPVAPTPIRLHLDRDDAAVAHSPIEDDAPAARRFLALLQELGEIGEGTADDHEIFRPGADP
jgi:hypothetical protein